MEIVALRRRALQKALRTLKIGLADLGAISPDAQGYGTIRDGVIQRFEYCIDSFWKFLKMYLEMNQKVTIESPSPRMILKLSSKLKIISDQECDILLDCVSDRNLTSHSYDEETAEKIQSLIPLYYETMHQIAERIHA